MLNVLIVIHLLLAVAMVGLILLQRSEGGALGIGGGGVMSGRAAGNLLTRATAIVAAAFFVTSLALALMANARSKQGSIMDAPVVETPAAPAEKPAPAAPISH
jgi:preprotein translocase subunit SecG